MISKNPRDRVVPTQPRRWKSIRLNLYVYAALALLVFVAAVPLAQANDFWSISGKITGSGGKVAATGANPDEIKGWMTIAEVIAAYKVPQAELYAKFQIPADVPTSTAVSAVEKLAPGFSVSGLRTWLAGRPK